MVCPGLARERCTDEQSANPMSNVLSGSGKAPAAGAVLGALADGSIHRNSIVNGTYASDRLVPKVAAFSARAFNLVRRISDAIFYRLAFQIAARRRGRAAIARVLPLPLAGMYTIWKTCMLLGLRITTDDKQPPDVAIYREDTTTSAPPADLPNLINGRCTDIGKDAVERTFADIFGYPLAIDTTQHTGCYVHKSRLNFAHDGSIRYGPIDVLESDCVYERLIENVVDDGWQVLDMRAAIVGTQIPLVFLLYRSIADRFGTDSTSCMVVRPDTVFSQSEQRDIIALAQAMGLDFGELDILRDNDDGRIYIVDVNKTPVGPPRPLYLGERHRSMRLIANAFATEFLPQSFKPTS